MSDILKSTCLNKVKFDIVVQHFRENLHTKFEPFLRRWVKWSWWFHMEWSHTISKLLLVEVDTYSGICWYHFLLHSIPYFLQSSQWTLLPTALGLTLSCRFFRPSQPLAICITDSSPIWLILHFGDISLSMTCLFQFVCKAWSWAAVMMASVFFHIYPIFSHSHDLLSAIALLWYFS